MLARRTPWAGTELHDQQKGLLTRSCTAYSAASWLMYTGYVATQIQPVNQTKLASLFIVVTLIKPVRQAVLALCSGVSSTSSHWHWCYAAVDN